MYRRNRYYDPKTGRFTQEDPIGLAGGLNTYGFADGDPVSYDDPYGLCPWCAVGIWAMRAAPFLAGAARLAREAADPNPDLGSAIVASGRIAGGLLRNQGAIRSSATRSRVVAQQLNRTGIRLANQLSKLDLTHLRAARGEARGTLNTGYDHVTEVAEAMGGVTNSINDLKRLLADERLSSAERATANGLLSVASRALDAAERYLKRD
jgi:hypothetical protein